MITEWAESEIVLSPGWASESPGDSGCTAGVQWRPSESDSESPTKAATGGTNNELLPQPSSVQARF